MEIKDIINNVQIYGLEESIRRAKFPMSVDPSLLTNKKVIFNNIIKIGKFGEVIE